MLQITKPQEAPVRIFHGCAPVVLQGIDFRDRNIQRPTPNFQLPMVGGAAVPGWAFLGVGCSMLDVRCFRLGRTGARRSVVASRSALFGLRRHEALFSPPKMRLRGTGGLNPGHSPRDGKSTASSRACSGVALRHGYIRPHLAYAPCRLDLSPS